MAKTPVEVTKDVPPRTPDLWRSFHDEMDKLFDRFAGGFGMPALRRWFHSEPGAALESSFTFPNPAVDVTETDKAYKITAELAGLNEKDVHVTVAGARLTIKGEKSYKHDEKAENRHLAERAYGSFQRAFALPEGVDSDQIAADMANGVLTITLPKTAQAAKQQTVEVKKAA